MGKFSLNLSAWCAKGKANPRQVAKKVVLDLGTAMTMKTPVGDPDNWKMTPPAGYVGGRARGSWQYEKGAPATGDAGTVDESGGASIARVAAGVETGDPADQHFITSTVPYMRKLEYEGWSSQAPDGMVRKTVEEFQEFVENAVKGLA